MVAVLSCGDHIHILCLQEKKTVEDMEKKIRKELQKKLKLESKKAASEQSASTQK